MESTLAEKITTNFFFIFRDIFIYFICNFFLSHVTLFSIPKKLLYNVRKKIKKDDNWLKNKNINIKGVESP